MNLVLHFSVTSTSTSLHYAVILDNSLVVRKKEIKEKREKIEVLDQSHKTTCEECKIEKERNSRKCYAWVQCLLLSEKDKVFINILIKQTNKHCSHNNCLCLTG